MPENSIPQRRRLRSASPVKTLYHYTSLDGAHKILTGGSLWASSIRHLNDTSELRYAFEVGCETFGLPPAYAESFDHICYVACFSADGGDSLSQWRAYGGHGTGVSLGFDRFGLERIAKRKGFRLEKCLYKLDEQRQAFKSAKGDGTGGGVNAAILRQSPRIKDPSFEDEAEWRLISSRGDGDGKRAFRQEGAMLVPYREVSLKTSTGSVPALQEVVVGPSPHPKENLLSVELLLDQLKIKAIVRTSIVPFRTR